MASHTRLEKRTEKGAMQRCMKCMLQHELGNCRPEPRIFAEAFDATCRAGAAKNLQALNFLKKSCQTQAKAKKINYSIPGILTTA